MPSERSSRSKRSRSKERSSRRSHRKSGSSRHERKRKRDVDTLEGADGGAGSSPPPSKDRREDGERSRSPDGGDNNDSNSKEISLSIEETNKLRAKLGLKPLEVDDKAKAVNEDELASTGDHRDTLITEDGKQFFHHKPDNWGDIKKDSKMREKLALAKRKRELLEKLARTRNLAEDEEDSTAAWVERMREKDAAKKLAEQKAKELAEMDEEFGVSDLVDKDVKKRIDKKKQKKTNQGPGFTVQHNKAAFLEGDEQILVLKDKDVLDEDDGETLVNPTLMEHDQWKKNAHIRRTTAAGGKYKPYEEIMDEDGNKIKKNMLDKYDEVLDGEQIDCFQIDSSGTADLSKERREAVIKAKLAASKNEISLDANKYQLANEYYTQEEMISFKKPKKRKGDKKLRKKGGGGMFKADDLLPKTSAAPKDSDFGSRERGKGRKKGDHEGLEEADDSKIKTEGGSSKSSKGGFKAVNTEAVDKSILPPPRIVKSSDNDYNSDDSDDDFFGADEDLTGIVVEDDAEDELHAVLDRTRKLKQINPVGEAGADEDTQRHRGAEKVIHLVQTLPAVVKEEPDDDEGGSDNKKSITLDSTSEYCRGLGDQPSSSRAMALAAAAAAAGIASTSRNSVGDIDNMMDKMDMDIPSSSSHKRKKDKKQKSKKGRHADIPDDEIGRLIKEQEESKGKWVEVDEDDDSDNEGGSSADKDAEKKKKISEFKKEVKKDYDSSSEDEEMNDILGAEATAGSSVAAALELATQKGYLEKGRLDEEAKLKHLEAKRYTVMDKQFHDIDDKYAKKLERMGVGAGPLRSFEDKEGYKPTFKLTYCNDTGQEMDVKEAFRYQSWKFHGKFPGHMKTEKRAIRLMEKNKVIFMDSADTPLETLKKQKERQTDLGLPYIVLSGQAAREMGLKKET